MAREPSENAVGIDIGGLRFDPPRPATSLSIQSIKKG